MLRTIPSFPCQYTAKECLGELECMVDADVMQHACGEAAAMDHTLASVQAEVAGAKHENAKRCAACAICLPMAS
jgi:hypothetical protein